MNKALRDKKTGFLYPILCPEDHPSGIAGYEYNRPSSKWELVRLPDGSVFWKGNNPEFIDVVELNEGETK